MKTFLSFLLALVLSTGISMAQKSPADGKSKAKVTEQKKNTPAETPGVPLKTSKTEDKPAAGPTKKDGTPDMRYKENKEAAKPAPGPTKKDGTPDMRYKSNKEAAKPAPKK
jgi:hypothetical protein